MLETQKNIEFDHKKYIIDHMKAALNKESPEIYEIEYYLISLWIYRKKFSKDEKEKVIFMLKKAYPLLGARAELKKDIFRDILGKNWRELIFAPIETM